MSKVYFYRFTASTINTGGTVKQYIPVFGTMTLGDAHNSEDAFNIIKNDAKQKHPDTVIDITALNLL